MDYGYPFPNGVMLSFIYLLALRECSLTAYLWNVLAQGGIRVGDADMISARATPLLVLPFVPPALRPAAPRFASTNIPLPASFDCRRLATCHVATLPLVRPHRRSFRQSFHRSPPICCTARRSFHSSPQLESLRDLTPYSASPPSKALAYEQPHF
jgi:hypothetical protein